MRSFANVLIVKDSIFACKYIIVSLFHRPHLWNNSIFSAKQSSGVLCLTVF